MAYLSKCSVTYDKLTQKIALVCRYCLDADTVLRAATAYVLKQSFDCYRLTQKSNARFQVLSWRCHVFTCGDGIRVKAKLRLFTDWHRKVTLFWTYRLTVTAVLRVQQEWTCQGRAWPSRLTQKSNRRHWVSSWHSSESVVCMSQWS